MPIMRLLWKGPRILEDRSPHVRHGTKPLARRAHGRSFATTSFWEPTSQHSPSMLQSSLHSSAAAWAAWKLTRILQSWGRGHRQSAVCTQVVRLLEVCTATTDWEETLLGCVVCGRVAGAARAKYILGDKVKATSFAELSGVHRSLWERGGVQVGWRVIRKHDECRIQCTSQETEEGIQWLHNEVD